MKPSFLVILFIVCAAASAQNKGTPLAQTGIPAPMMYDSGDPVSLSYPCDASHTGIAFYNLGATVNRPLWICNGSSWIQASSTFAAYTASGLQGTPVKCWYGNTTSATTTGAWSVSYSNMGLSTLLYINVDPISTGSTGSGINQYTLESATTTGASGHVVSGTVLSILGATLIIQPVGTTVYVEACGY